MLEERGEKKEQEKKTDDPIQYKWSNKVFDSLF